MSKAKQKISTHDDREALEVTHRVIEKHRSKEIFIAVVGPVGAGSTRVIDTLKRACIESGYKTETIKASLLIRKWHEENTGNLLPDTAEKTLEKIVEYQNAGDQMRAKDAAEVARCVLREIAERRAKATDFHYERGKPVPPDNEKRAYLIDSIRHPAEVHLLRRTYGSAFALVGVVCEESRRKKRILEKYFTKPQHKKPEVTKKVEAFMKRDSDDLDNKRGQHVSEAFFEADYFVDNSIDDPEGEKSTLDEPLGRLVNIIAHDKIIRPTIEETAMHHAHSAKVRSACLSRQVGAALVDADGTVVATGVNEVPVAGGGVYGEGFELARFQEDHRCVFRETAFCSNNSHQNKIIDELIESLTELSNVTNKQELASRIRRTRLGSLIEFSRAVHAEMDALLSAGREGVSTVGTRLFVTTFPCHYCARHIVGAGVYEVQYIEPYPKSLALDLHDDAIETDPFEWHPPEQKSMAEQRRNRQQPTIGTDRQKPGKVLFKPFVGTSPRMYTRAFEKTWRLKDKVTGKFEMEAPEWGDEWSPFRVGYPQLEAALSL
ncbi:anti-phage dCTP deaminase [Stappia sp. WLB 29]|uniref:anti-phage dCTP deaminase n=1 Tax=Stappia sp. WLB 29 TaxID=2925220 RepID=UPI0020BE7A60|nr:anti-phage dCTP deaminase [Stappia sp. WLB 29]